MDNFEITSEMLDVALQQVDYIEREYGIKIIFEDPIPFCAINQRYYKYMHPCEWGISKVSVDYKGNLSRCGADVYHSFGSIFDDVDNLWNTNINLEKFREKNYLPNKCKKCILIDKCGGGCPISKNPECGFTLDYLSKNRRKI